MSQACILDFGNTRVKWARFVDGEFAGVHQDDEAWESLQDWSEDARWLIAASGPIDERWTAWVEALKANRPDSVVHLESAEGFLSLPLTIPCTHWDWTELPTPQERQRKMRKADWLIIDAGTCITADLLQGGKFCGGSIAPGIDLRLRAMFAGTASLPYPKTGGNKPLGGLAWMSGDDTVSSLIAGAVGGAQAELTERIRRFTNEIPSIRVALTGGDAKFLQLQADLPTFADPNLTWKGYFHLLNRMLNHD